MTIRESTYYGSGHFTFVLQHSGQSCLCVISHTTALHLNKKHSALINNIYLVFIQKMLHVRNYDFRKSKYQDAVYHI